MSPTIHIQGITENKTLCGLNIIPQNFVQTGSVKDCNCNDCKGIIRKCQDLKEQNKKGLGRPTKYNPDYHPQEAKKLAEQGLIDIQIAEQLGITGATFYNWKKDYLEFFDAVEQGKQPRLQAIEETALKVATGYYQHEYEFNPDDPEYANVGEDVKQMADNIFKKLPKKYYKPSEKILSLMMYSLFGDKYKDKSETTIKDPLRQKIQNMTHEEKEARIKELEEERKRNE